LALDYAPPSLVCWRP